MRILFSSYHNPAFVNTNVYKENAFETLGHELIRFDDRAFVLPGRIRQAFPALAGWDLGRLNSSLARIALREKPDLCLVSGGHRILPGTLESIRSAGIPVVLWTTDAPLDIDNISRCAPLYDHVFCSGTEAVPIMRESGAGRVSWLPFACCPEYHHPSPSRGDGHDVVFVGSYYPGRAKVIEAIHDLDVMVAGPGWSRLDPASPLRAKAAEDRVNYDRWVRIYGASKIVLVPHYDEPGVPCDQASPRVFEAMACGAFVLSDDRKDVRALFRDGTHLALYSGAHDMREKVTEYLSEQTRRREIAQKGRREVLERHTYVHRARTLLTEIRL